MKALKMSLFSFQKTSESMKKLFGIDSKTQRKNMNILRRLIYFSLHLEVNDSQWHYLNRSPVVSQFL